MFRHQIEIAKVNVYLFVKCNHHRSSSKLRAGDESTFFNTLFVLILIVFYVYFVVMIIIVFSQIMFLTEVYVLSRVNKFLKLSKAMIRGRFANIWTVVMVLC